MSDEHNKRLFVDIDGTLAVFTPVDTFETLYKPGYYENLEPIESTVYAVTSIIENNPDIEVFILSAYLSDSKYALSEKNSWIDRFLPEIGAENRIFMPYGEDKKAYIPGGVTRDDRLLDDYTLNLNLWETDGTGIKLLNGINHTNETWQGYKVSYSRSPKDLANSIAKIFNGDPVYDEKPQKEEYIMSKYVLDQSVTEYNSEEFHDISFTAENQNIKVFKNCRFNNCKFNELNMQGVSFEGSQLTDCEFKYANLTNSNMQNAGLYYCTFTGTNLAETNLSNVSIRHSQFNDNSNLSGTNLTLAKMDSVYFRKTIADKKPIGLETASITMGGATNDEVENHKRQVFEALKTSDIRSPAIQSDIKPGDVIYSTIQLDGTDRKAKRLLFVADVNKNQELTCLNITSAKENKNHDLFEADQPIPKTEINGLNRDSYVKTNVEYILSANNYKFKMEKINISQEDFKKVMSRYNKMKQKGKVKQADNRYDRKSEFDKLNQKVMDLTQQFKESPEILYDYQQFSARFYQFSARNTALIYAQNKNATFVASYSDWKNKFEYNVKRDMKAIYLLRPVTNEYFKRDNKLVPVSEATEAEKQKIAKKELEIHKDTYFVRYPVYDISQTTCPKKDYPKVYDMGYKSLDHILRYECVKQFAQGEGFAISEKPIDSISLHGYYSPSDNSIVISDKLDDSKKLSTLCHEVSHGLMHQTSTSPKSVKEFEAEALSVMMCTRMGIEPEQSSARYLAGHYNKIDHEKCPTQKSMERIKKAFDYSDTKIQKNIQSNPAFQMEMEKQQSHKQPKQQQEDNPGKMASGGKPQNFIQH